MGSSASKTAHKVALRKFPTRPGGAWMAQSPAARPSQPSQPSQPTPATMQTPQQESSSHDQDHPDRVYATDPDMAAVFSDRLHKLGIVQPMPTFSSTSTAAATGPPGTAPASGHYRPTDNATLSVLEARRRLHKVQAAEVDGDDYAPDQSGREFLPAGTLRDILQLRAEGVDSAVIEKRLRLKPGVVSRLGPSGLVEVL